MSESAWGGKRENQTGRPTKVPTGEGEKQKVTVTCGGELLDLVRQRYPNLSDQDAIRAAMWEVVGQPQASQVPEHIKACV